MFDLFRSRAKAVRYLLGALLLLVAVSMLTYLIPGSGLRDTGGLSAQVVAQIGDDQVTLLEVQKQIQAQLRGRNFPPEMAGFLVPQIVDSMVTEELLAFESKRLGFDVSDDNLASAIQTVLPQLFQGGKFAGRDAYAAILGQRNMTIPEFEATLGKQLLVGKLRDMVLAGVAVTPGDVEREFRRRNEKVKVEYASLSPDKYRPEITIKPAEIQDYFNRNRSSYSIPEKRALDVVVVDESKVAQSVSVPEADLRRAYDQNKDSFRIPERVRARHILLKTTDVPKDGVPKIRAQAEDILKQLKAGADFAALAKKNSQDPGSGAKGGDLGWLVRGQTVKNFEDMAFSLKPNELSGVISTEYGFHIIQVLEKQAAHLRPFEEVRGQLLEESKKQLVNDRMQNLADQARAAVAKEPLNAEAIAGRLGIQCLKAPKAGAGDPLPEVGSNRDLWDSILPLRKGELTPVVQVQQTKLAFAVVTDLFPARPAELSEVEGQIRQTLTTQKLTALVSQKAREALDKTKQMNGDLKKVAQSMGLEFKTPPEFGRNGAAEGLGSASNLEQAFTQNAGEVFGPVVVGNKTHLCKTVGKTPADMSQLPAQRDSIVQELKQKLGRQRYELFEEGLRDRLIAEGKVKIHRNVIDRLVSSYSGR